MFSQFQGKNNITMKYQALTPKLEKIVVVLSKKHAVKFFEKRLSSAFLQFVPMVALESWCKMWCRLSKKNFFFSLLVLQTSFLEFSRTDFSLNTC